MAGQPKTRAKRAAAAAAAAREAAARERDAAHHEHAVCTVPDEQVVALAGAVLLGQYRGTIAASGAPLRTSLEVLDDQLPDYVARVLTWVGTGPGT